MTYVTVSMRASDTESAMRRRWCKAFFSFLSSCRRWLSPMLRRKQTTSSCRITRPIFVTVSSQGGNCVAVLLCNTVSKMDHIQNLSVMLALRTVIYHLSQNILSLSQDARISENYFKATLPVVTPRDDFLAGPDIWEKVLVLGKTSGGHDRPPLHI
jgi:hypothetical protein